MLEVGRRRPALIKLHRAAAPLRPAEDAVIVDTSQMDFRQSEEALLDVIRRKVGV